MESENMANNELDDVVSEVKVKNVGNEICHTVSAMRSLLWHTHLILGTTT